MRKFLCALWLFSIFILITPLGMAQSLTSGDISGTVTDPSGAVVKDAIVNIKSLDTGAAQTSATGDTGMYRFSLLKPGRYTVKVTQQGFQGSERQISVNIGQVTTANFTLKVGQATEVVEVTGALPVVNVETAGISTAYDARSVSELPNPGGDLSNIAQLAPGVIMNTMSASAAGYGNFNANGMSALSNLFTVNGENYMDPFFNVNSTGPTNLSLGQDEIQEATVVTNPYSGQYGQQAGAQVNYITKSGTNAFHGSAKYMWNGRAMNANNWYNKNVPPDATATPRPFVNANQWGADFGGPIKKDKTFFYVNTEGARLLIPTVQSTYIPTTTFANAVLANIENTKPEYLPMYQKLFGVWLAAPGAQNATPEPASCGSAAGEIAGLTADTACMAHFSATPGQLTTEWILSGRIDHNFSDNDRIFGRFRMDHGLQATSTDPINSAFNATSNQPAYDGQLQWNHIFSGTASNQFIMSGNWYSAVFKQNASLVAQTFPYDVTFGGEAVPLTNFGGQRSFPQGRNITQYQFVDDFTKIFGNHTLKFGGNFRRYDVSDFTFFYQTPGIQFRSLLEMANGDAYRWRQYFPQNPAVPIAMYGLGMYGMDEWKVNNKLKLTLALRAEHNSNPVCQIDCFSLFTAPFGSLQHGPDVPYNQSIQTGLHQAYRSTDALNLSPRIGFTWAPFANDKTVVSGGIGLFYDAMSQGIIEDGFSNVPFDNQFSVYHVPWAVTTAGSGAYIASSSNRALLEGFAAGQSFNQIYDATGGVFSPPGFSNFVGTFHTPQFQEWNLQVQQAIGSNMSVSLNYFGTHGIHIPVVNGNLNAYDPGYCGDINGNGVPCGAGFRSEPLDSSYAGINEYYTGAVSNSNGLTASFTRRFAQGISVQANYTWSHALDETSNGGAFAYTFDQAQSLLNPGNLRANNYGNADYDVRHNFSANFVWEPPHKFSNSILHGIMGGWMFSGTVFARTGMPYTVWDDNAAFLNMGTSSFGVIPAQPLGPGATFGSGTCQNGHSECYDPNAFVNSVSPTFDAIYAATGNPVYAAFPTQRRNQYRGPGFFNSNFSLNKNFNLTERAKFGIGANFYNVFNHANFYVPYPYLSGGKGYAGIPQETVSVPASPFGNFLGADASPRLIQLQAKITF